MKTIEDLKQYKVIKKKDMPDLGSRGFLLQHIKSGARVFVVSNDDRNKVFYVAFRTPPADSTGTPHILEHTVLCGSEKYKAKDPFIELAKGSLNTFLNAMTYSDKTVYPVASTNDKDFANLSDVYMDSVFHPAIYENRNIFLQEGWHYELLSEKDELKYNGVVYNEMKGAFSTPDDLLDRYILASLYPDTAYALESGGDPEEIPELTYERFLEMHKKYYHPSNSYIYLYGDCDMVERLTWLDKEYLSHYKAEKIDSGIERQDPFTKTVDFEKTYGLSDAESTLHNTYLSYNCVIKDNLDPRLYVAFAVLQYALLESPGAPLKQALLDARIGQDIDSSYDNGILQPYFAVIAKYADVSDKDKFLRVIRKTLTDLVRNGLNRKTLLAGINSFEFRYREADFGNYPKGLMYGLQALDSWLYKDNDPFMHIEQNSTYAFLKKEIESGSRYFEDLIEKYLIENPHSSVVLLKPEKGLTAKREKAVAKKLQKYKASLSPEEIKEIIRETKELKAYQEEPSTAEELMTVPLLEISDIDRQARPFKNDISRLAGVTMLHHDIQTNGIAYIGLMLSSQSVPERLVPYIGLLAATLGNVNTAKHKYEDLNSEIDLATGGIYFSPVCYPSIGSGGDFDQEFEIRTKVFVQNIPKFMSLAEEILFSSDFSDEKRMREIIRMVKSRLQTSLVASGNDALFDAILSFSTLVAGIISILWNISIEGILGVIISLVIIKASVEMLKETVDSMIGSRVDAKLSKKIKESICEVTGVYGVYDLSLHNYGPESMQGSVHVEIDGDLSAIEIHRITRSISIKIYEEFSIILTVGVYARNNEYEDICSSLDEIVKEHDEILEIHGFIVYEETNTATFDMVVDFEADREKVKADVMDIMNKKHPEFKFYIIDDYDLSD